jgi:hypothetical protein
MHLAIALALATLPATPAPAHFVRHVDNPWFPLRPGETLIYDGELDGKAARDVFAVTRQTRRIRGVLCTAVRDHVFIQGKLVERTIDWYAQDDRGNVWYFGEQTATLDAQGKVTSREGSWLAGRKGARAGIFMPVRPRTGKTYQQEFFAGHAEDRFTITSRAASVSTPYATTRHALKTKEFTPLEPGVFGAKLYVYGIGQVAEQSITGDPERFMLTDVIPPSR